MARERDKHEFRTKARSLVRKRSKGACVITGERLGVQMHHLLHIWWAVNHDLNPQITHHPANGVLVNPTDHNAIHNEINSWDNETQCVYFRAIYSHIVETARGDVSPTLQEIKMPLYEIEPEHVFTY